MCKREAQLLENVELFMRSVNDESICKGRDKEIYFACGVNKNINVNQRSHDNLCVYSDLRRKKRNI